MLERVIKLVFNSELLHLLSKILMWFDVTGALGVSESADKACVSIALAGG